MRRTEFSFVLAIAGVFSVAWIEGPVALCQDASPAQSEQAQSDTQAIDQEIAALIQQLGHPVYQQRINAEWALQMHGLAAFEQLREAAQNPETSIEIANAAEYLIQSQDVIWYLDTDSNEVRSYLNEYDKLDDDGRISRIRMLRQYGSEDAILALCRLARFERHERVSKEAALSLIHDFVERYPLNSLLLDSLASALGDGRRPAVVWLRQVLADQQAGEPNIEQWSGIVQAEIALAKPTQRAIAIREHHFSIDFFTAVSSWLRTIGSADHALAVVAPAADIIDAKHTRLSELIPRVLDEWELPQFVPMLAARNPEAFDRSPELGYLLAEAYLKAGEAEKADTQAEETSRQVGELSAAVRNLSKTNSVQEAELVAGSRYTLAGKLWLRGMFPWAENEFRRALEVISAVDAEANPAELIQQRFDWRLRIEFAQFYLNGGEYEKAAKVLEPAFREAEALARQSEQEPQLQNLRGLEALQRASFDRQRQEIRATYFYFAGLAAIKQGREEMARTHLQNALKLDPDNPDIVIAMRDVATTDESKALFESQFREMRDRFRRKLVQIQEQHANAQTRRDRKDLEGKLAESCNELAWLLGKCESDLVEAIQLSEQSLQLVEEPFFLDTLARCYFSAGRVDEAIATQRKAVQQEPFDRMMAAQLKEFELAAKQQEQDSES